MTFTVNCKKFLSEASHDAKSLSLNGSFGSNDTFCT